MVANRPVWQRQICCGRRPVIRDVLKGYGRCDWRPLAESVFDGGTGEIGWGFGWSDLGYRDFLAGLRFGSW